MRTKLLCGNWKMNLSKAEALALAASVRDSVLALTEAEEAVCALFPPFPYLDSVSAVLQGSPVKLGAQTLHEAESGAYTGEVSASMLVDMGCELVIIGHSERRHGFGESDVLIAAKASRALDAGLTPVVCVGETGAEREAGETEAVLARQIEPLKSLLARCVLAYEPVWAIGTGQVATPEEAEAAHAFLRARLGEDGASVPILYGGSLNSDNACGLFRKPNIDGGLVGGASLKAQAFSSTLAQLNEISRDSTYVDA